MPVYYNVLCQYVYFDMPVELYYYASALLCLVAHIRWILCKIILS